MMTPEQITVLVAKELMLSGVKLEDIGDSVVAFLIDALVYAVHGCTDNEGERQLAMLNVCEELIKAPLHPEMAKLESKAKAMADAITTSLGLRTMRNGAE